MMNRIGTRGVVANQAGFTHDHNLYHLVGNMRLGFELAGGELLADPHFVNPAIDFRLQPDSPAIDAGASQGPATSIDGHTVPYGKAPDIGAFEYAP